MVANVTFWTFTCRTFRGTTFDGSESHRNAQRSRWDDSRRLPYGHLLTGLWSIPMNPDLEAANTTAAADNTATPTPLRLQLDPNRPSEPDLDGAWWPRSPALPAELPALLGSLSTDLGPIALVGYHRDTWEPAPDRLDLAGHPVHLVGFCSPNPPTLIVIADTGRRITLRVVAPEADCASAARAMTAATHHSVEQHTGGPANNANAAETRSLDEVASRLSRLPGNTDPEQAALISNWVDEAADQFSNAPIQAFVPILVEHIVRGRLYKERSHRGIRSTQ
jgi:hypothetical protein